ncbi:MAG: hypothetical protein MUC98_15320 [Desulfobacterota bacterium]|nr:hypothetical protein [Thermodesulfobacteriota bacterium]
MGVRFYQILDVRLRLESTRESLLETFHRNYARFAVPVLPEGPNLSIRFEAEGPEGAFLEVNGCRDSYVGHAFPERKADNAITAAFMDRVEAYTVLHGAVLGSRESALAISGSQGAGKTTLTLALLKAGWTYLSDDFCPIHRETGLVHPFPRSLWVRPRDAQEAGDLDRGKILVPLEDEGIRVETRPLPLRWLFCLVPPATTQERVHLTLRPHTGEDLLAELRARPWVTLEASSRSSSEWDIAYAKGAGHTAELKTLLDHHHSAVWGTFSLPEGRPDFSQRAVLDPITPHEAALFLLRELKHAPAGVAGRMKPGALLIHLADILSGVRCFHLSPGELPERLVLIQGVVGEEARL